MAIHNLAPVPNSRMTAASQAVFRQHILNNAQYWRDYVATKTADVKALERGRTRIVRAIKFGFDHPEAWPFITELVETFSPYMERCGQWEAWHWILSQALESAVGSADLKSEVVLTALLARLSQRQGRLKKTVRYYRRTLRLARRVRDQFNEARACTNLSFVYIELGHWYRAEVLGCHALHIFETIDNDHGRAHTENHLGILYTHQGLWEQAQAHLERACAIWQKMGDDHGLMRGLLNLCLLCNSLRQPGQTLHYAEQAFQQAQMTGETLEVGRIHLNVGTAHQLGGDLTKAEIHYRQAETIFRRYMYAHGLANVLMNLGKIYLLRQEAVQAIPYLQEALADYQTLKNKLGEIQTMVHLAEGELTQDNREQAFVWINKAGDQLKQHPQAERYNQLPEQIQKIRCRL